MKSALFAVAVTALAGGMLVAQATQQSAQASMLGGVKSGAAVPAAGDLILVGRKGGGGGFKGGGGRSFKGGGGFKGAYKGGSFKGYRGGGKYAYRGGGSRYAYKGRNYSKTWNRGKTHGKNYYKGRRYAYRGRYYRNYGWYGPGIVVGAYGYGGCAWLRRQALATGSAYWWNRYYACVGYY